MAARLLADSMASLRTDLGDDPPQRIEVASAPARDEEAERVLQLLFPLADQAADILVGDRGAAEDGD